MVIRRVMCGRSAAKGHSCRGLRRCVKPDPPGHSYRHRITRPGQCRGTTAIGRARRALRTPPSAWPAIRAVIEVAGFLGVSDPLHLDRVVAWFKLHDASKCRRMEAIIALCVAPRREMSRRERLEGLRRIDGELASRREEEVRMTVAQVQSERRRASRHQNRVPSPVDDLESGRGRARDGIVSRSSPMLAVLRTFRRAAASDATILITGESGTGKELVARAVHAASHRAKAPMVTVNMSAVPEALVESELFGHIKGSFTSASHDRIGRFEAAHGGTLFIDEIGDLQPSSQPKLLRALETHSVTPVGSSESRA